MLQKRNKKVIAEYRSSLGLEVLNQLEEVSIDLWKPDKSLIQEIIPNAQIVADRFHLMKQINQELDERRKQEKRAAVKIKNRQERLRCVFESWVGWSKNSVSWHYGLKLHLTSDDRGELLALKLTPGNIDDRQPVSGFWGKSPLSSFWIHALPLLYGVFYSLTSSPRAES